MCLRAINRTYALENCVSICILRKVRYAKPSLIKMEACREMKILIDSLVNSPKHIVILELYIFKNCEMHGLWVRG